MNISEMTMEEIEARSAEILGQLDGAEGEVLEQLRAEAEALNERKAELAEIETRTAQAEALTEGEVQPDKIIETVKVEEKRMEFTRDSREYRDAFFAMLVNKATPEQRAIVADGSAYGDGLALPVATDEAIWDQVLTQHPILTDVAIVKSGIVMKVTQMTPSNLGTSGGVKGKKDSEAVVELTFAGVDKVLAGHDYSTYVTLTYAEAKMSAGAMEKFLVTEIANALGELLAKDVFTSIITDAAANAVTKSGTYYEAIGEALGKASQAVAPVIYAPSTLYYAILKEVDTNGQPIVRDGVVLGAELKKDNAAANIVIVDPAQFVLNVVADTQIKSSDDVKNASYVIGGYLRAEGCLRKVNAAAFI